MKVLINKPKSIDLPLYGTKGSSGVDVKGMFRHNRKFRSFKLFPLERALLGTGITVNIPDGYELQLRPRSGFTLKTGIVAHLGTIDSDYHGEIGIILHNLSGETVVINSNERLGQLVLAKVEKIEWEEVKDISSWTSERGDKGFGSTGKK